MNSNRRKSRILAWTPAAAALLAAPLLSYGQNQNIMQSTPPPTNQMGVQGLIHTGAAQSLEQGRFNLHVYSGWYNQEKGYAGGPDEGANIFSGVTSLAYGVSPFVDLFGALHGYGSTDWSTNNASGLGAVTAGARAGLPWLGDGPVALAAEGALHAGLSNRNINNNGEDGYAFQHARQDPELSAGLIQSLGLAPNNILRLHLNEGIRTKLDDPGDPLVNFGVGLQADVLPYVTLGTELNSRTNINDFGDYLEQPVWATPSIQVRTPYNLKFSAGSDIALSQERSDGSRALEPYQVFGAMTVSFDLLARQKAELAEREAQEELERQRLAARANQLESEAQQVSQENEQLEVALTTQEQQRQQELQQRRQQLQQEQMQAEQAQQRVDSLQQALDQEKQRVSDVEKRLITDGMLVMDAVYFEPGEASIKRSSQPYLKLVGEVIAKYPELKIELAGYTDNIGSADYNQQLSLRRAQAVKDYLTSIKPDLADQITARGYGENDFIATNNTAEGREENRRVELNVLNREAIQVQR